MRPILEYASIVWAPYTKTNIEKLESVQRRAARFEVSDYDSDFSSSVTSILNELKWCSLEVRRQVSRLMMFYKILQGSVALELPYSGLFSKQKFSYKKQNLNFERF